MSIDLSRYPNRSSQADESTYPGAFDNLPIPPELDLGDLVWLGDGFDRYELGSPYKSVNAWFEIPYDGNPPKRVPLFVHAAWGFIWTFEALGLGAGASGYDVGSFVFQVVRDLAKIDESHKDIGRKLYHLGRHVQWLLEDMGKMSRRYRPQSSLVEMTGGRGEEKSMVFPLSPGEDILRRENPLSVS